MIAGSDSKGDLHEYEEDRKEAAFIFDLVGCRYENAKGRRDVEQVYSVRLQVLTATGMKITAFWDITPCSLVEVDRRFRGVYCHHQPDTHRPDYGGSKHH
jgi:hypothetical protein